MADYPELTTIGAIFGFARSLEQAAAQLVGKIAEGGDDEAGRIATKHSRRADDLERARKEKMNETVLEPITAMDNAELIPPSVDLEGSDDAALRAAAVDLENRAAAFYDAAVDKAGPVLVEVRRQFERMAKDSRKYATKLAG